MILFNTHLFLNVILFFWKFNWVLIFFILFLNVFLYFVIYFLINVSFTQFVSYLFILTLDL